MTSRYLGRRSRCSTNARSSRIVICLSLILGRSCRSGAENFYQRILFLTSISLWQGIVHDSEGGVGFGSTMATFDLQIINDIIMIMPYSAHYNSFSIICIYTLLPLLLPACTPTVGHFVNFHISRPATIFGIIMLGVTFPTHASFIMIALFCVTYVLYL